MAGLPLKSAAEALYIAAEMERRAVRLYERAALLLGEGALGVAIEGILADERQHLQRFSAMLGDARPEGAEALTLAAYAAGILFEGGLNAAVREGAFDSPQSLLRYAAEQERIAVDCYTRFSEQCADAPGARAAFLEIAQEESSHLSALNAALSPS